jgi:hypothetical protein
MGRRMTPLSVRTFLRGQKRSPKWYCAVQHSVRYPAHNLRAYLDDHGNPYAECAGDGNPSEPPNCDFDTATHPQKASLS